MTVMKLTAAAAAAVLLALPAQADARDLRIASGAPPPHPATSHLYNGLAEYLPEESGGSMGTIFLGPEVAGLRAMKDACRPGW